MCEASKQNIVWSVLVWGLLEENMHYFKHASELQPLVVKIDITKTSAWKMCLKWKSIK